MTTGDPTRVFVETNFLLEFAFEQAGAKSCEVLLELGERREIVLALPVFSLFEARDTAYRREQEWEALKGTFDSRVFRESTRMTSLRADAEALKPDFDALIDAYSATSIRRLDEFVARTASLGNVLPMEHATIVLAAQYRKKLKLKLFDAVVLATIIESLVANPGRALFINLNVNDFGKSTVRAELAKHSCALFGKLEDALGHIRNPKVPP